MSIAHTLHHALFPAEYECRHSMADIIVCVICNRWLDPERRHVDTCNRCFPVLLKLQREGDGL